MKGQSLICRFWWLVLLTVERLGCGAGDRVWDRSMARVLPHADFGEGANLGEGEPF